MSHNARLFLALVMIAASSSGCLAAEATDSQVDVPKALVANGESISAKLIHMRHLLKSLFMDWNLGESNLKDVVGRTFGFRMRMIRKIMLPLAFIGGFMTAVILSIKMTGLINMLMIKKVLLLQMAIILGKLIYGFKELLMKHHGHYQHESYASPPQAYYIPISHGHGHGHGWNSREDEYQPNFYPGYNQQPSYQLGFSQAQANYSPQASQQVRTAPQYAQPYNQGRNHDYSDTSYESPDNRISSESGSYNQLRQDLSRPASPLDSMSPQEMTRILSDAIARVSARTTPSPVSNRSPNIPSYVYASRS